MIDIKQGELYEYVWVHSIATEDVILKKGDIVEIINVKENKVSAKHKGKTIFFDVSNIEKGFLKKIEEETKKPKKVIEDKPKKEEKPKETKKEIDIKQKEKKGGWSEEEEDKLKELYPKMSVKELSKLFGRSESAISRRIWIRELKKTPKQENIEEVGLLLWTDEEEEILIKCSEDGLKVLEMMDKLPRFDGIQIRKKLLSLGLQINPKKDLKVKDIYDLAFDVVTDVMVKNGRIRYAKRRAIFLHHLDRYFEVKLK